MERRNHPCIEYNIMLLMAFGENDLKKKEYHCYVMVIFA